MKRCQPLKTRRISTFQSRQNRKAYLFLAPSILGVSIFVLLPFLDVFRRSFITPIGNRFVGFANYQEVWHKDVFLLACYNTLRFLLVCIPLLVCISLLTAVMIETVRRGKEFFQTALLLPLAIPVASIVVLWKMIFHSKGVLNQVISIVTPYSKDWMNGSTAFGVLVFSYLWKNIGYDMILWMAGLSSIPTSLYEAARVDGAGRFKQFIYITLPQLKPVAGMVVLLSIINSFKVFREAYLVAGGYPDNSIYLLQHLFNNWFLNLDIQKMSSGAVSLAMLVVVPALLVITILDRKHKGR